MYKRQVEYACEQCSITIPCDIRRNAGNLALPTKELYRLLKGKSDDWEEKRFAELIRIHYRTINSFPFTSLYPGMKEILDKLSGKTTCLDVYKRQRLQWYLWRRRILPGCQEAMFLQTD